MSAKMTEKKGDVLHILRDTLRFHKEMGIAEYPDSQNIQNFLNATNSPGGRSPSETLAKDGENGKNSVTFDTLEEEIYACTLCQLSTNSPGRVSGKGKSGCRLMIVGDYSHQSGSYSKEILFGREEDAMLWKMMTAIGLGPETVYVTNSLKCCPDDPKIIDGKCEERCFSFLAREIGAVNPEIICTMGEMPVRGIMGKKDPLARLRGHFSSYRYQSGKDVPVMPTFHPRFLLKHQEMKKATWNDLQAIMRRLDAS